MEKIQSIFFKTMKINPLKKSKNLQKKSAYRQKPVSGTENILKSKLQFLVRKLMCVFVIMTIFTRWFLVEFFLNMTFAAFKLDMIFT